MTIIILMPFMRASELVLRLNCGISFEALARVHIKADESRGIIEDEIGICFVFDFPSHHRQPRRTTFTIKSFMLHMHACVSRGKRPLITRLII